MSLLAVTEEASPHLRLILRLSGAHHSFHCRGSHQEKVFEQQHLEQMAERQVRDGKTSKKKIAKVKTDIKAQPYSLAVGQRKADFSCACVSQTSSTPLGQSQLCTAALHG